MLQKEPVVNDSGNVMVKNFNYRQPINVNITRMVKTSFKIAPRGYLMYSGYLNTDHLNTENI